MILVADSGSSKTDWILQMHNSQPLEFRTRGINPFYQSEREIVHILHKSASIHKYIRSVKEVHFFGAGCSSPDRRELVSNALSNVFKNAFINVENDLLGSVYATCGNTPGLTCILGTGSNSAFFDGRKVLQGKHGLGYILGDEGSGSFFGKALVTDFLYGKMPKDLSRGFRESFNLTKEVVLKNVYQHPFPNIYLASFPMFMSRYPAHPYIKSLLERGFREYIETNILSWPEYRRYNVHFVGSIAANFKDALVSLCKEYEVGVGKILAHPIRDLYSFILESEGSAVV